jgi:hypothetical protein
VVRHLFAQVVGKLAEKAIGLVQQLLAGLVQRSPRLVPQRKLLGSLVWSCAVAGAIERERKVAVGKRLPGDALGVKRVGFALTTPLAVLSSTRRATIAHVVAALAQKHRGKTTDAAGTLDPPALYRSEAQDPLLQGAMTLLRDFEPRPDPGTA